MAADKEKNATLDKGDAAEKVGMVKRVLRGTKKRAQRCMTPRIMLGVVIASFVLHGVLYWYYSNLPGPQSREVELGTYEFIAHAADGTLAGEPLVRGATFDVHISLLSSMEGRARELITLRQTKLRQAIEELIRQARDREFADPELVELKRRLIEQINHTLGLKAVDEVMITDLRLNVWPTAPQNQMSAPIAATDDSAGQ